MTRDGEGTFMSGAMEALFAERDRARAERDDVRAERDALAAALREYVQVDARAEAQAWKDGYQEGWRARKNPVSGEVPASSVADGAQPDERTQGRVAETGNAGHDSSLWPLTIIDAIEESDRMRVLLTNIRKVIDETRCAWACADLPAAPKCQRCKIIDLLTENEKQK